jgi:hypothetical protein
MANLPVAGSGFTFSVSLFSQTTSQIVISPTIEAGDFKISTDGGALTNLTNLPTETPAGSGIVQVDLTASEVGSSRFSVNMVDVVGSEWKPIYYHEILSSTLDTSGLADVIWDEALSGHTVSGSAGAALSSSAACGGGVGSVSYDITVCDSDSNPLDGAAVWVTTDIEGLNVVAGTLYTDALGNVTFMLDPGTYYGWQQLSGYNFTNPTSFSVV